MPEQEQEKTDTEQYADAFKEATNSAGAPVGEDRSSGKADTEDVESKTEEGKGEQDSVTGTEDKQEGDEKRDAGSAPKGEPSDDDLVKDPAKLLQQFKSLKGTYNWAEKQRRDLEAKLKEKESGTDKPVEKPSEKESPVDDDDDIKFLKEEYPDVYKGMSKIVERVRKETEEATLKTVLSTLAPLIIRDKETAEEKHFKTIAESHGDYKELSSSGVIDAWIDQQPAYKAKAYRNVVEKGSSDEVIDLLNDYKKANGIEIGKPRNGQPKPKRNPLETGESLSAGRRVTTVKSPSKSSANDYESAFNEAVSGIR